MREIDRDVRGTVNDFIISETICRLSDVLIIKLTPMIRNDRFDKERELLREERLTNTSTYVAPEDPEDPYYDDDDDDDMAPEEFIEVEEEEEFNDSAIRSEAPEDDDEAFDDDDDLYDDEDLDPDLDEEDEYFDDEELDDEEPTTETDAPQTLENPRGTLSSHKEDRNPGRIIGHEPGTV